ncbi:MAG: hypothetical protein GY795_32260 [Desulfobacterales bacterium]|nr:hypothetical protein [Desulfobacterales bacterium]
MHFFHTIRLRMPNNLYIIEQVKKQGENSIQSFPVFSLELESGVKINGYSEKLMEEWPVIIVWMAK